MKASRILALMLALAVFFVCSIPVHAQQEVDPDHFDQPRAASTHIRRAKTQSRHSANTVQRHTNEKLASAPSHKTNPPRNTRPVSGASEILGG